jgi:glycosyltransferase involved in cell wall biosynthesis
MNKARSVHFSTVNHYSHRIKRSTKQQSELISIIIPVYRNADTLHTLYYRLYKVLKDKQFDFEVIFVNDDCPVGSLAVLESIAREHDRVAVLVLDHNVGQHQAVLIGLTYARGSWIVIMDADLQDPPEAIPPMLSKGREGFAAVFAGRRGKYESFLRLITSKIFKGLLHLMTGVPADAGIYVAINRDILDRLLSMSGSYPFIVAMIGCTGMPMASIPVVRVQRPIGHSAYNFSARSKSACRAFIWVLHWKWRRLFNKIKYFEKTFLNYRQTYAATNIVSQFIGSRFGTSTGNVNQYE